MLFDSITLSPQEYVDVFFMEKGYVAVRETDVTFLEEQLRELIDRVKYYEDYPKDILPVLTEINLSVIALRKNKFVPDPIDVTDGEDEVPCGAV